MRDVFPPQIDPDLSFDPFYLERDKWLGDVKLPALLVYTQQRSALVLYMVLDKLQGQAVGVRISLPDLHHLTRLDEVRLKKAMIALGRAGWLTVEPYSHGPTGYVLHRRENIDDYLAEQAEIKERETRRAVAQLFAQGSLHVEQSTADPESVDL
jgi:hypothetical protein